MQDGTFTCGFPYHADSHLQRWESGVSPVNGVEHVTPIDLHHLLMTSVWL